MRKITPFIMAGVAGISLLSGCATDTKTSCALNNTEGYCASVQETHEASRANAGSNENVFGDGAHKRFKNDGSGQGQVPTSQGRGQRVFSPGPGAGLAGPIYRPAQPRRLWVAPWTDANGVVHSGEYLYFLRPGNWNYGPLREKGSASGVMGPVAPSDLGFDPAAQSSKKKQRADSDGNVQKPGDIQRPSDTFTAPRGRTQ